jgi:predicted glycoside hydrolase/deacetylase ChbG (UPF0249 family)
MCKKIIINADDFGINNSITDSIIYTCENGIVSSTTIMSNMDGFEYAVNKAKRSEKLKIGIHYNLTEGKPISQGSRVQCLIDEDGHFKNNLKQRKNLIYDRDVKRQVRIELESQLIRLLDYGIVPTHYDSHHHITGLPVAFMASKELAVKYKIKKARVTSIDYKYLKGFQCYERIKVIPREIKNIPKSMLHKLNKRILNSAGILTPDEKILLNNVLPIATNPIDQFMNLLSVLRDGITEVAFHPGSYYNNYDAKKDEISGIRNRDYSIAINDDVRKFIEKNNIKIVNYENAFNE